MEVEAGFCCLPAYGRKNVSGGPLTSHSFSAFAPTPQFLICSKSCYKNPTLAKSGWHAHCRGQVGPSVSFDHSLL